MLGVGNILVPFIFMSGRSHLLYFAANKTEWLVSMLIGNQSSKIGQMLSFDCVVMVALLPTPIKNSNIPQKWFNEQRQTHREVMNKVHWWVLQPLTFKQNPCAESGYYNILCAYAIFRHCKPVSAAWIADCTQYCNLQHLERHVCYWCECPKNELDDYVPPDRQQPRQDHNLYWMLSDAITNVADAQLSSHHVHKGFNVFRHIPCIVERPPYARSSRYNADRHAWSPPEVDFPLHDDARSARQVQGNMVISVCLPRPDTNNKDIWGSLSMQWEGDEGNEPETPLSNPYSVAQLHSHRRC